MTTKRDLIIELNEIEDKIWALTDRAKLKAWDAYLKEVFNKHDAKVWEQIPNVEIEEIIKFGRMIIK